MSQMEQFWKKRWKRNQEGEARREVKALENINHWEKIEFVLIKEREVLEEYNDLQTHNLVAPEEDDGQLLSITQ